MRRYIVLLLITGTVWAQTELDKLVLKDGSTHKGTGLEYFGEYLKMNHNLTVVYFKPQGTSGSQPVPIKSIHTLQLKDGRVLIYNGSIREKTFLNSLEYEKLTSEQKAVYNDLKKRKFKNIITFTGLTAAVGYYIFLTNFSLGGGFSFGP